MPSLIISLSLKSILRSTTRGDIYGLLGFEPALVFDFKGNYFRKAATYSTFSSAMTHAASTNATMVDSDGLLKWRPHNNITQSNDFSTWGRVNSTTVDNAVDGPTGIANTASTVNFNGTTSNLYRLSLVAVSAGDKVTLAAWVRSDTITSLTLSLNGRVNGANNTPKTNLTVTSNWTLVTFEATVLGNDQGLYFIFGRTGDNLEDSQIGEFELYGAHMYRSDLGGMVNNLEQPTGFETYVPTTTTAVYGPRVGHHIYNGTAWVNEGILHESEARTNLLPTSNNFSNWSVVRASATTSTEISPSGSTDAFIVKPTVSPGLTWIYYNPFINTGVVTTISTFAKASGKSFLTMADTQGTSRYASFNLTTGTVGTVVSGYTAKIEDFSNGWYRCSVTTPTGFNERAVFAVSDTDGGISSAVNGDDGILVYGAQVEAGSTPSSYIPTTGATVTRAADILTVPAANLPYDSTNMSIQMDGKMTYADNGLSPEIEYYSWLLSAGNYVRTWLLTVNHRTGQPSFQQRSSSGVVNVDGNPYEYSPGVNVPFNLAARHGSTFINGASEGTALTANTTPTVLPDLSSTDLNLGYNFMGTIGQFRMWDEDLTDAGIEEAST